MAKKYSAEMTGVLDGNTQDMANGAINAGRLHSDRHTFVSTGANYTTSDTLSLGYRKPGDFLVGFIISSSADLSAASLAIGVSGTAAKYKAAATLPNASSVFVPCVSTALDDDVMQARTEIIGTISGATIAAGTLVIIPVYASK